MISKSFRLCCWLIILFSGIGGSEIWAQTEGLASYYHSRFHGRVSSSGRIHNKEELVAAHRTYPFGTFPTGDQFEEHEERDRLCDRSWPS